MKLTSLFSMNGNKIQLLKYIEDELQGYNDVYVEPFFGTGAIFYNKQEASLCSYVNDINPIFIQVHEFFKNITKKELELLFEEMDLITISKDEFKAIYKTLNKDLLKVFDTDANYKRYLSVIDGLHRLKLPIHSLSYSEYEYSLRIKNIAYFLVVMHYNQIMGLDNGPEKSCKKELINLFINSQKERKGKVYFYNLDVFSFFDTIRMNKDHRETKKRIAIYLDTPYINTSLEHYESVIDEWTPNHLIRLIDKVNWFIDKYELLKCKVVFSEYISEQTIDIFASKGYKIKETGTYGRGGRGGDMTKKEGLFTFCTEKTGLF